MSLEPIRRLARRQSLETYVAIAALAAILANLFMRFALSIPAPLSDLPLYAALLSVFCHIDRVITLARAIDPGIDERLLEGLVVLQNPVDDRMLRPIA